MDGSFDGGDDGRGLYQMVGTVTEWNGTSGNLITDSGERVTIHRLVLAVLGRKEPLKVGDRVHFWASKRVHIKYEMRDIGTIVPQEPDHAALKRLRDRQRAVEKQRDGDDHPDLPVEELTGAIDSFDPQKGYGFIRCDNGERVMLHVTCLRASGYREAVPGSAVRFKAFERKKGWVALRILSLEQPSGRCH